MKDSKHDFIAELNECAAVMSLNNHYLAFFHDCISIEINIMGIDKSNISNKHGKRILHPLPIDKIINYFLPMYTDANDPVYKTEDELFFEWLRSKNNPNMHFHLRKEYYAQKNSWVVKKILSLNNDFTENMIELANGTGIPLKSLHNMYVLMTGIRDFSQSPNDALLPFYLSYPVPKAVPENQRDDLIFQTWKKIFDLLLEAYWVIALVSLVDVLNVLGLFKADGLAAARAYLVQSTVYTELEKRVVSLKTPKDLRDYMTEEFPFFEYLMDAFQGFAHKTAGKFTRSKKAMEDLPLELLKEPIRDKGEKEDINSKDVGFNNEAIDHANPLNNFLSTESPMKDALDEEIDGTEAKDEYINLPEKSYFNKETHLSDVTVLIALEKRMEIQGLLKTYHLKGDPSKAVNYLMKTIYNEVRTIIQNIYSSKIQEQYGITQKTWQRWKEDIKKGIYNIATHPDRPSGVNNISDLFSAEIEAMKKAKQTKQYHRREGYFTQNQLIQFLQGDSNLELLLKNGIEIKKYGRTALRNRFSKLIKMGKIPYQKDGVSYLFKITDMPLILSELSILP